MSSILIGRSIPFSKLRSRFIFHFFQYFPKLLKTALFIVKNIFLVFAANVRKPRKPNNLTRFSIDSVSDGFQGQNPARVQMRINVVDFVPQNLKPLGIQQLSAVRTPKV